MCFYLQYVQYMLANMYVCMYVADSAFALARMSTFRNSHTDYKYYTRCAKAFFLLYT